MKRINTLLILTLLILAISLSACGSRGAMVASGWAGITTDEDTAYVSFNTHVVAVDLSNGTQRWRYPAEADAKISFYAPPTLTTDGRVIVGGYDNLLYSIDATSGQGNVLFAGAEGRYVGGALATNDHIYAPSADHFLYALDYNGNLIWDYETSDPLWAKPVTDPDCNCIYIPGMDHKVHALDAQTGDLVWETEDLGGAIVGTPAISDDEVLYVGTFANEMLALDTSTGDILWRFGTQDWVWAGPELDKDILYFGDISGTFYALDRQNGISKWQIQPEAESAIVGKPLLTEDGIYFTNQTGSLISVNYQGGIQFNQPLETSLHSGPVQAKETIIVATSNPEKLLIAVEPSGVQRWSFGLAEE